MFETSLLQPSPKPIKSHHISSPKNESLDKNHLKSSRTDSTESYETSDRRQWATDSRLRVGSLDFSKLVKQTSFQKYPVSWASVSNPSKLVADKSSTIKSQPTLKSPEPLAEVPFKNATSLPEHSLERPSSPRRSRWASSSGALPLIKKSLFAKYSSDQSKSRGK